MRRVLLACTTAVAMVAALFGISSTTAGAEDSVTLTVDVNGSASSFQLPDTNGDADDFDYTVTVSAPVLTSIPVTLTDTTSGDGKVVSFVAPSSGTCSVSDDKTTVTCTDVLVTSISPATLTVKVDAPDLPGTVENTAVATPQVLGVTGGSDSAKTDIVAGTADLEITTFTGTPDPVHPGGEVLQTITVENEGSDPADSVTLVVDTGGTIFDPMGCTEVDSNTVSCDLGGIADNGSVTKQIVVTAPSSGTSFSSTATATENDDDVADPDGASATLVTAIDNSGATYLGPGACTSFTDSNGNTQEACNQNAHFVILTAFHSTPGGTDSAGNIVGPGVRVDVEGGTVTAVLVIVHDACRGVGNQCIQLGWRELVSDQYKLVESCPTTDPDPKAPCEVSRTRLGGPTFRHEVSVPQDPEIGPLKIGG